MLRKIENRIFPTLNEAFENMTDGNSAIVTSSFEDLGLILCNTYCQARVQVPNPLSQQAPNPDPKVRPNLKTQKHNS